VWKDNIDERAEVVTNHLRDFARLFAQERPRALAALGAGLDYMRDDWLKGLSEAACDRLLDAIGEAERAAERDPWLFGEEARGRGFPALVLLVSAGPDGAGATRDPKLRIAAMHARRLRSTAHTCADLYSR
jgi:hypothetical protein